MLVELVLRSIGQIRKDVDLSKANAVEKALHRCIREDLRLGACPRCP
jgi:hypothetical protein